VRPLGLRALPQARAFGGEGEGLSRALFPAAVGPCSCYPMKYACPLPQFPLCHVRFHHVTSIILTYPNLIISSAVPLPKPMHLGLWQISAEVHCLINT